MGQQCSYMQQLLQQLQLQLQQQTQHHILLCKMGATAVNSGFQV